MSHYVQRKDGEGWTIKNREIFKFSCCDCGLVHELAINVPELRKGKVIGIAAKRNNRATSQRRKIFAVVGTLPNRSIIRRPSGTKVLRSVMNSRKVKLSTPSGQRAEKGEGR